MAARIDRGSRVVVGLQAAAGAAWLYATRPILVAIALGPTVIRAWQVVRGGGTPAASGAVEGVVGGLRIALALAVLAVGAGWRPLSGGSLRPPSLAATGSAWTEPGFRWATVVVDLAVYAVVYLAINAAIALVVGQPMLGGLLPARSVGPPSTATGLWLFVGKNLLVIPVATIHVLWALRLVDLPGLVRASETVQG